MKKQHKIFLIAVIVFVAIVVVAVTPVLNLPLLGLYSWFEALTLTADFYKTLALILGALLLLVIFALWILPVLIYAVKKLYIYISLWFICLFKKHKFRLTRMPFASLKRLSSKGDIRITTNEGVVYLHFLDLIFTTRRALTILSDTSYVVTRTTRGDASHLGRGHIGTKVPFAKTFVVHAERQTLEGDSDKIKRIDAIEKNDGEAHILIIQSLPVESRILIDGAVRPLTSGQDFGALKFYSLPMLKKGLRGKLHNSVFNNHRN